MTVFADTSALVKVYADEEHSELVRRIWSEEAVAASILTWVELASALWAKQRGRHLDAGTAQRLVEAVEIHFFGTTATDPAVAVVGLEVETLGVSVELAGRHGLRAGDAIQLACAEAALASDPELTDFLCFDRDLRVAAAREGFSLLPAEL